MSGDPKHPITVRRAMQKARAGRRKDILREQAEKEMHAQVKNEATDTTKAAAQTMADNDAMGGEDQVAAAPSIAVNNTQMTESTKETKAKENDAKPKSDNGKKLGYTGKGNQNRRYYAKKKTTKSQTTGNGDQERERDGNKENMQPATEDTAYVDTATIMLQ